MKTREQALKHLVRRCRQIEKYFPADFFIGKDVVVNDMPAGVAIAFFVAVRDAEESLQ